MQRLRARKQSQVVNRTALRFGIKTADKQGWWYKWQKQRPRWQLLQCEPLYFVEIYSRFEGTSCFCISKQKWSKRTLPNCRYLYNTTRRHIPKDSDSHHHVYHKSRICCSQKAIFCYSELVVNVFLSEAYICNDPDMLPLKPTTASLSSLSHSTCVVLQSFFVFQYLLQPLSSVTSVTTLFDDKEMPIR